MPSAEKMREFGGEPMQTEYEATQAAETWLSVPDELPSTGGDDGVPAECPRCGAGPDDIEWSEDEGDEGWKCRDCQALL